MIRILPALLGLAAFASAASAADRRFPVTDFDRLIVEGPYEVRLAVGGSSSAIVSGTREGLDRIVLDVQGQTLRIRRSRTAWGGVPGADTGRVTIRLTTRNLRSARLIGPAILDVEGARGLNLEFAVEGSGRIRATVAADNLSLGLLGSGGLDIAGRAGVLRGDFQGTGNVEGARLIARQAAVTTTTTGTVALTVNGPAAITANGLGNVTILGRAVCTVTGPGADLVRCGASNQR